MGFYPKKSHDQRNIQSSRETIWTIVYSKSHYTTSFFGAYNNNPKINMLNNTINTF